MSLSYEKKIIKIARTLRKNMTKEEKMLWYKFLRNYPLRFQKQKCIDKYIVDFYCHKAQLIVELDGSQHFSEEGKIYDEERTRILTEKNLKVLRYTNLEINNNFKSVCEDIDLRVQERIIGSNEK